MRPVELKLRKLQSIPSGEYKIITNPHKHIRTYRDKHPLKEKEHTPNPKKNTKVIKMILLFRNSFSIFQNIFLGSSSFTPLDNHMK